MWHTPLPSIDVMDVDMDVAPAMLQLLRQATSSLSNNLEMNVNNNVNKDSQESTNCRDLGKKDYSNSQNLATCPDINF